MTKFTKNALASDTVCAGSRSGRVVLKTVKVSLKPVKATLTRKPDIEPAIKRLVDERHSLRMTQSQVSVQMGTTASAVARLESGGGRKRHSPSLRTLKLYAEAIGFKLDIQLVPL